MVMTQDSSNGSQDMDKYIARVQAPGQPNGKGCFQDIKKGGKYARTKTSSTKGVRTASSTTGNSADILAIN